MSELIISVSGLRGIVGKTLTPEIAARYAGAFSECLPAGPIVITNDGRESGPMLAGAIQKELTALGRDVFDAGVAATPTTGVLVRSVQAAGGIQISASHNPAEYNGLKLFSSEGRVIPASEGQKVLARYQAAATTEHNTQFEKSKSPGAARRIDDTISAHLDLVLSLVNVERIRAKHFHVLLDANHGSGSVIGRPLLESLGCRVTVLGGTPDGKFEHTPEPTAENLSGVLAKVRELGADAGFCTDPDADRLAVIDERARYIGEEYTLALCVDHVLGSQRGPMVTNCSTSRMSEDLAKKYNVPFFRSAVGEANVVDRMRSERAILGGEGNGGVIEPKVGWVRDSMVGMAYLLDAMAKRNLPISQLADELPRYEIVKAKATVAREKVPLALAALEKHFAGAELDKLDGLRLDWPGKWLLVRASNTEPIVRAIAEAATAAEARRLCDESVRVLESI